MHPIQQPSMNATGPAVEGVAAAFLTSAWVFARDDYFAPWYRAAYLCAGVGLLILVLPLSLRGMLRRAGRALLLVVLSVLVLASVDWAMAAWEARSPWFGLFSQIAAPVLSLVGYDSTSSQGLLHVRHPEGLVSIAPSMEKTAVRWLVDFWTLWVSLRVCRDHRRWIDCAVAGALITALVGLIRYVALLLVYLEHDNILVAGRGQAGLDLLAVPYLVAPFLLAGGFVMDRWTRTIAAKETGISTAAPEMIRLRVRATVLASLLALGFGTGVCGFFEPPGKERAGRILIDDRFCGVWEPAARQLDTEWYGDFPTYSFNSLAEWLGHWFVVDVNTSRSYDENLLKQYDMLIVKTPVNPIPESEREAIDRFVRSGGGLLVVGDHTNLLGMGTHLNSLCAPHGIRFRYDSISPGYRTGFSKYTAPRLARHVAASNVNFLEFMTSCSLALAPRAEAVLVAGDCRREPHDYAASSFFGRHGPHPELEHGRAVLAATVGVGRGRIAAFTDSTVWSSFAVFRADREKLLMGLVSQLNRQPGLFRNLLRAAMLVALVIGVFVGWRLVRGGAGLPTLLSFLVGLWSGVATAAALNRATHHPSKPREAIHEVAFLWKGGACAFPPVLGSLGSLPADQAYDTLLVTVQRLGLVPRIADTYDRDLLTPDTKVLVVIAPVDHPPKATLERIEKFVNEGGSLVVIDDSRFDARGSAGDYLAPFDAPINYHHSHRPDGVVVPHAHIAGGMSPVPVRAGDSFVVHKRHGSGQVVYMRDAADFSRKGMGHCFARPWNSAHAKYDTVFMVFGDVLELAPFDRRLYGIL